MKTFILILGLMFFTISVLNAQQSIPASGGHATGDAGSVSYTVGQVVYNSISSDDGTVTEGVQQPWEISVVDGIDFIGIDLSVSAFPNPTSRVLNLSVAPDYSGLSYLLYDINGKVLQNADLTNSNTIIEFQDYAPSSVYLIKVVRDDNVIKTFKILKN